MRIVQVHIEVKPTCVEAFIEATTHNARESRKEAGIDRFEVLQSDAEATRFILFEVYLSADAQAAHKQTAHFKQWKADVETLIVSPGRASLYASVVP